MNLTDEEIRIKVAEACEWLKQHHTVSGRSVWRKNGMTTNEGWDDHWVEELPNYHEDLNACAAFEATLMDEEWETYADHLLWDEGETGHSNYSACKAGCIATARQRCLAYLKTKGLIP